MAAPLVNINDVPQAIQLALGPVFLLTAIAATLNVFTGRLARIIDRARFLTEQAPGLPQLQPEAVRRELQTLERRRGFTSTAITACTFAALLDCMVVLVLFLEAVAVIPLKAPAGALFACSTLALVVGLSFFLREVLAASDTMMSAAQSLPPPAAGRDGG